MASSLHVACIAATLVGCYVPTEPAQVAERIQLETPYDASAASWADQPGDNSIDGTALLRTRGGEVRTCAALKVTAVPATTYAQERMAHLYKSLNSGFNLAGPYGRHPVWANDTPAFYASVRQAICDAQGRFHFDELADGEWYVEAIVAWEVGYSTQGGSLMRRVRVAGGETTEVVLTAE